MTEAAIILRFNVGMTSSNASAGETCDTTSFWIAYFFWLTLSCLTLLLISSYVTPALSTFPLSVSTKYWDFDEFTATFQAALFKLCDQSYLEHVDLNGGKYKRDFMKGLVDTDKGKVDSAG